MIRVAAVLMMLGVVAGCDEDDDPTDTPRDIEWSTDVEGLAGFEAVGGDAEATWTVGESNFTATAEIAGDAGGSVRPWHVHAGTCGSGGAIVGGDAAYPRLNVSAAGTDTVTVNVPVALDSTAAYYVNYHLSVTEMGTIIACGELDR